MLGDLAKLLVYGYVGSEMGKEVKKRMDERKKEQAEAIQELKNFACVIYDGKAIQSTYHDFYALGNGSNWGVYI